MAVATMRVRLHLRLISTRVLPVSPLTITVT